MRDSLSIFKNRLSELTFVMFLFGDINFMIVDKASFKQVVSLKNLLNRSGLKVQDFCALMNIHRGTLAKYRNNEREFRLNMTQIKALIKLLESVDIDISSLPDDWIVDKKNE